MNKPLAFAALAEVLTGVALAVAPALVGRLLLGAEATGIALVVSRVAGIALIALGISCWPSKTASPAALGGMTIYGLLIAIYLVYLGIQGEWVGPLLWPGVALHTVLTVVLAREWISARRSLKNSTTL